MTTTKRKSKDLYQPSVYGVGYIGLGEFKAFDNGSDTYEYKKWHSMMRRCYDKKSLDNRPSYKGCSVHSDWHNFQNFAKWLSNQEFNGSEYHLDKDLLVKGNKIYSESTCSLVPLCINNLLVNSERNIGRFPMGVSYHKNCKKYVSMIKINGKRVYLGLFDCPKEAHEKYAQAKKDYVHRMANDWRTKITNGVFDALIHWSPDYSRS